MTDEELELAARIAALLRGVLDTLNGEEEPEVWHGAA